MSRRYDLGSGFSYSFFCWKPDRDLNPHLAHLPDIERAGVLIWRGDELLGGCHFDTPECAAVFDDKVPRWRVVSLDPLHLEPSIQMHDENTGQPTHHGFIRGGKWIQA